MKTLTTSILMNAPQASVWQVLSDFTHYCKWNPFLCSVHGKAAMNAKLVVKAKLHGLPPIVFKATICNYKPLQQLGWRAVFVRGVFEAHHYFTLEAINEQTTQLIHTETFSGLVANMVLFVLESRFMQGYHAMNESLSKQMRDNVIFALPLNKTQH